MNRRVALIASAMLAVLAAPRAGALVNCTVSATGPAFGIYNPLNATPLNSNGNVAVTCTLLTRRRTTVNATVTLSTGSSATFTPRTLVSGTQKLGYNLYLDAAYSQIWGDGTAGTADAVAMMTLRRRSPTQQVNLAMYGRIPAGQDVGAGSYLDTIVVTVNY
jgi:spore coat protein U-like protein